ncbi:uncharacterized protein J3D65DRAFT_19996 [Phyllosticta citribraziliensis]|uniref:DUF1746 domain-containing protein n=1 Tax=Phyllosticta citribraziliensis TaxID=989973 RepID=A0ABR1M989_9PEZI
MNDEASPSSADGASEQPNPSALDMGRRISAQEESNGTSVEQDETALASEQKKKIKTKRIAYLDDLLRSLDILIYTEISAVYYLDCSFLRFFLRAFIQLLWLTPKPEILPDMPTNRPYIYPICGTNLICLLAHLWFTAPSAGEATRGYLHGGLLIDWIGQHGQASKSHLILLDFVVFGLQLIMLSATLKMQKVKKKGELVRTSTAGTTQADAEPSSPSAGQDVDSEERGVLRRSSTASNLQDLVPNERDQLQGDEEPPGTDPQTILDTLSSGQALVAELFVADTVREQFDIAFTGEIPSRETLLGSRDRRLRLMAARLRQRRAAFNTRIGSG